MFAPTFFFCVSCNPSLSLKQTCRLAFCFMSPATTSVSASGRPGHMLAFPSALCCEAQPEEPSAKALRPTSLLILTKTIKLTLPTMSDCTTPESQKISAGPISSNSAKCKAQMSTIAVQSRQLNHKLHDLLLPLFRTSQSRHFLPESRITVPVHGTVRPHTVLTVVALKNYISNSKKVHKCLYLELFQKTVQRCNCIHQ